MTHNKTHTPMTLDRLAQMVARGFDDAATKQDLIALATKDDLNRLEKKVDKIDYRVDEVYDILKRFEEHDILNLQKRVQILEKAVRTLAGQISK